MSDLILKSIMDNVIGFLQSPTGKLMLRQTAKMLPYYLPSLKVNFQQMHTKIEEVSSEGKIVIKKIQETKFAVNEPNNSIINQAQNMTINVEVNNYIYVINPDSIEDYKKSIDSADVLLERMEKVDIKNIKNEDVQIEVNNCIDTSDELLKKIQLLIEKHNMS